MKVVYIIGVFDLFHRGHVELLRKAKLLGDKLIVAVNGDELVASYKRRPFINEYDRLAVVESCKYVDESFIIRTYDNKDAVVKYSVDIIVHGSDWQGDSYLKQIRMDDDFLKQHKMDLVFLPYTEGISTSDIIKSIKER